MPIAEALGFKRDTFANRKNRGSIPSKEIKNICYEKGINYDWVMSGAGTMRPSEASDTFKGTATVTGSSSLASAGQVKATGTTIAEQLGEGYSPEVKLMADYLEVKVGGKTREERLSIIEDMMAELRDKYK